MRRRGSLQEGYLAKSPKILSVGRPREAGERVSLVEAESSTEKWRRAT